MKFKILYKFKIWFSEKIDSSSTILYQKMSTTVVIPDSVVEWTSLEQLALVSAIVKKGDSNWPTVSRLVRPYISPSKNIELFSAKNCALKYDHLLEQVG